MSRRVRFWSRCAIVATMAVLVTFNPAWAGRGMRGWLNKRWASNCGCCEVATCQPSCCVTAPTCCEPAPSCSNPMPTCCQSAPIPPDGGTTTIVPPPTAITPIPDTTILETPLVQPPASQQPQVQQSKELPKSGVEAKPSDLKDEVPKSSVEMSPSDLQNKPPAAARPVEAPPMPANEIKPVPAADDLFSAPSGNDPFDNGGAKPAPATDDPFGTGGAKPAPATEDPFGAPTDGAKTAPASNELFEGLTPPSDAKPAPATEDLFGGSAPSGEANPAPATDLFDAGTQPAADLFAPPAGNESGAAGEMPAPPNQDTPSNEEKPKTDSTDPFSDLFSQNEIRAWKDNTGNFEVHATLAEIHPEFVRLLKTNGNYCKVPLRRLSEADRSLVLHIASKLPGEIKLVSINKVDN